MGFMSSVYRGHSRTGIHLHSRNILVPLELWHVARSYIEYIPSVGTQRIRMSFQHHD